MPILKSVEVEKTLTIKIPSALAERIANTQARAKAASLTLDLDSLLKKPLMRMLREAEAELEKLEAGHA